MPHTAWQTINIDFALGRPKISKKHDSKLAVVDRFSKMTHFIPCSKTSYASRVVRLFFDEVVRLCELPKAIVSNMDI